MIDNMGRRKSISKMTQQGRTAKGKECSGRSPPSSSGSGAIGDMAIVIALFLCAHGQRSGVRYAFPGLLDVVLDSSDDREPGGSVKAAGMFLPNFRALSGLLGNCSCSAISKKRAAPRNRMLVRRPRPSCVVDSPHSAAWTHMSRWAESPRLVRFRCVCKWLAAVA